MRKDFKIVFTYISATMIILGIIILMQAVYKSEEEQPESAICEETTCAPTPVLECPATEKHSHSIKCPTVKCEIIECPLAETLLIYPRNGMKFSDYIIDKFAPLYSTMLTISDPFKYKESEYDCTQYSKEFVLDLRKKGIDSVIVHGTKKGSTTSHAWVFVGIEPQTGEFVKVEDAYLPEYIRIINNDGTITNKANNE